MFLCDSIKRLKNQQILSKEFNVNQIMIWTQSFSIFLVCMKKAPNVRRKYLLGEVNPISHLCNVFCCVEKSLPFINSLININNRSYRSRLLNIFVQNMCKVIKVGRRLYKHHCPLKFSWTSKDYAEGQQICEFSSKVLIIFFHFHIIYMECQWSMGITSLDFYILDECKIVFFQLYNHCNHRHWFLYA